MDTTCTFLGISRVNENGARGLPHPFDPSSPCTLANASCVGVCDRICSVLYVFGPFAGVVAARRCVPRAVNPGQSHSIHPHWVSFMGSPTPSQSSCRLRL